MAQPLRPAQRRGNTGVAVVAAAGAIALGVIGAVITDLGPWYYGLRKPTFQPPDWLFGPAWTLIFGFTAYAGYLGWISAKPSGRRAILLAFAANAALNVAWSWLFFRLQRPDWALIEVAFLWLSIVVLIRILRRSSKKAAMLLLPYLLWVTFASAVNYGVVVLNGPFG